LWHIPGPNPIVAPPVNANNWASEECEVAGGVVGPFNGTYSFIYHCTGSEAYRVGISSASHPLGPWTTVPDSPNLDVGDKNSWENEDVASLNVIENPDKDASDDKKFLGFYEGGLGEGTNGKWTLGLAYAPTVEGPWEKYENNPIMDPEAPCDPDRSFNGGCNGLYVGSVLYDEKYTNREFWMYAEGPINENDEGPMGLWTSLLPEGPWTFKDYVLDGGLEPGPNNWDAGRYSESGIHYHGGLFHAFLSGSDTGLPLPNKDFERIGWATSEVSNILTKRTVA